MKSDNFLSKEVLLAKIDALKERFQTLGYPNERVEDRHQFRELADDYNQVVEELVSLEERPRYDPIERLPEEVWLEVLTGALTTETLGQTFLSVDMALYLTSVSAKWRQSIESAPLLWTDVVYDEEKEDLAAKIAVSLQMSRNASIFITFLGSTHFWDQTRYLVEQNKDRIRGIYHLLSMNSLPIQKLFASTVEPLYTSHLNYIDCIQDASNSYRFTKLFSHPMSRLIRNVSPPPFTYQTINTLSTAGGLRQISTLEDALRALELSKHTPSSLLRVVFLLSYRPKSRSNMNLSMKPLGWTSLEYQQGVLETLEELLRRTPLLENLDISRLKQDPLQIMASMKGLHHLQHLSITLTILAPIARENSFIIAPLRSIRRFTFRDTSDSTIEPPHLIPRLVAGFFQLMPDLEILEIESSLTPLTYELVSAAGFQKVALINLASR